MDFILIRTSDYGEYKPIDLPNVRVEENLGDWYREDEDRKRNVISLSSLDDLSELLVKFDKVVVIPANSKSLAEPSKYPIIEIYDFYRE